MSSTLLAPQRTSGSPDRLQLPEAPTRTTVIDRVALHVGLRLLIWSTRPVDRERHARLVDLDAARARREHDHLRRALLAPSR